MRRERLPIPIFWPGEFHGQRSLAGYSPWSCKELDTIEHQTLSLDVRVRTRDTWSSLYFPSIFPRNLTDPRNKEIIIIIRVKQIGMVILGVFPSIYAVL